MPSFFPIGKNPFSFLGQWLLWHSCRHADVQVCVTWALRGELWRPGGPAVQWELTQCPGLIDSLLHRLMMRVLYSETLCWWQRCAQRLLGLGSQDPVSFGHMLSLKYHLTGLPGFIFRRKTEAPPVNRIHSSQYPGLKATIEFPTLWDTAFLQKEVLLPWYYIPYPTPFFKRQSLTKLLRLAFDSLCSPGRS